MGEGDCNLREGNTSKDVNNHVEQCRAKESYDEWLRYLLVVDVEDNVLKVPKTKHKSKLKGLWL